MTSKLNTNLYIIFPVHNRLESTKRFLRSVSEQTVQDYKLVICDDGSTDGTGEYLAKHHPEITVLEGNGQLWWTAGINRCVEYVLSHCEETDFILTLNNDATLPPAYLEQKLMRAAEYKNAIIGSLCVHSDNPNVIESSGYVMDFSKCDGKSLTRAGEIRNSKHKGIVEVTHLPGKGVLIPANVFKTIGLYDEAHLPQYHADTDFTLRAHKVGTRILLDYDSVVFSEVNTNNMVLPAQEITLKGMINTFKGRYSMNNYWVCNNFAVKHFKGRKWNYLARRYYKVVGGLVRRYISFKIKKLTRN